MMNEYQGLILILIAPIIIVGIFSLFDEAIGNGKED